MWVWCALQQFRLQEIDVDMVVASTIYICSQKDLNIKNDCIYWVVIINENCKHFQTSNTFELSLNQQSTTPAKLYILRLAYANTSFSIHCCYLIFIFLYNNNYSSIIDTYFNETFYTLTQNI